MDFKIKKIKASEVLDSRGNPTVEVNLSVGLQFFRAIVPSGASTGIHEALELRDDDKKRYNGKGVLKAVNNVNSIISKKLIGKDCTKQKEIDSLLIELDGTDNKSKLGANAILAVSMANCIAGASCSGKTLYNYLHQLSNSKKLLLPVPQMNIINSGAHAGVKNDVQEHMIIPTGFKKFSDALRAGVEAYNSLKKILRKTYGAKETLLGDEGGFSPHVLHIERRLELMLHAIKETGYSGKIQIGLDCAASEFYNKEKNNYKIMDNEYSQDELADFYSDLIKRYPIISIEDGFAQDDWKGWSLFNKKLGNKIQIVGDDLLVTNMKRMDIAIKENACNALLLKINQIGTITESIDAANLASKNRWNVVVSHRSGETEDNFIADLTVGLGASQSKFGAPARSERTAKYNRLLRIEEELGNKAEFSRIK
ncbi:MAG TPA: phosphopyruvate hydratase [Candidatus Nanoarchaeia archaeon]|nr:phosphopyruvate hydratase [Candidatus Nanoarchaeia archaeon]